MGDARLAERFHLGKDGLNELVTGKAGTPHVSSADDGRRIAGEVGVGSYVLQTGGRLAPSLVDANTVRFATGDMVVQGRHIGLTAPEDVKVASGTQGKKRTDYICVHYKRDVSGANPTLVETCEWKVLQGTPGTDATAPSVPAGSILDGDADVTVPIARVDFNGLTTGTPKLLIPALTPLADLGDSVSQWSISATADDKNGVFNVTCCAGIGVLTVLNWPRSEGSWDSSAFRSSVVLPERYRPSVISSAPAVMNNQSGNGMCFIEVQATGTLGWSNHGGLQTSDPISGTVCWSYPL